MARRNQNLDPKALDDINYYETTGSAGVKQDEADAINEKSEDAVTSNLLLSKVSVSAKTTNSAIF